MYWRRRLRRWARALIGPACGIALTGYFAYNLVIGDRGLAAWRRLTTQIQTEDTRLASLQAEQKALARKVSDLSPDHLDLDLLDERVRSSLNLVAPNEIVVMRQASAEPKSAEQSDDADAATDQSVITTNVANGALSAKPPKR